MEKMDPSRLLQSLKQGDLSNIVPRVQAALAGKGQSALAYRITAVIAAPAFAEKTGCTPNISSQICQACCLAILDDHEEDGPIAVNSNFMRCVLNLIIVFGGEDHLELGLHLFECFLPIIERMKLSMREEDLLMLRNISYRFYDNTWKLYQKKLKNEGENGHGVELTSNNEGDYGRGVELTSNKVWSLVLRTISLMDLELGPSVRILKIMFLYSKGLHKNYQLSIDFFFDKLTDLELLCKRMPREDLVELRKMNDEFTKLLSLLGDVLKFCLTHEAFSDVSRCLCLISSCMFSLYPASSEYALSWQLGAKIMKTLIFSIKELPRENQLMKQLQDCVDNLEICTRSTKETKALHWTLCTLISVLSKLYQFWSSNVQALLPVFTPSVIVIFKQLADGLCKQVAEEMECSPCTAPKCPSKKNFELICVPITVAASLASWYSYDSSQWEQLKRVCLDAIHTIEMLAWQSKEVGCIKSSSLFISVCSFSYKLAKTCRENKETAIAKCLLERAAKSLLSIWEEEWDKTSFSLNFCAQLASDCNQLGKIEEARVAIVLPRLVKCQNKIKIDPYFDYLWVCLQNKEENRSSVVDFIRKESDRVKAIYPSFQLENIDICNLLLWELSCYASHRVSSGEQILHPWLALKGSNPVSLDLLRGSILSLKAAVRSGRFEDLTSVRGSVNKFSEEILKGLSKEEHPLALCFLGVHTLCHFLCLYELNRLESEKKTKEKPMEFPAKILTARDGAGDVPNPNDTCEPVLAYRNLSLKKEAELLLILNSAIKFWEKALSLGLGLSEYSSDKVVAGCSHDIVHAAFLCNLLGSGKGTVRAWKLCLSFGERMKQDYLVLQACSGLMNLVECESTLISRADELAKNLEKDPEHKSVLYMYYNSKAFHALCTKKFREGITVLQRVKETVLTSETTSMDVHRKSIMARFSVLPKSVVDLSDLGPLSAECAAYDGLKLALGVIRKFVNTPEMCAVADQLLSLSHWLGRLYLWTKQPRPARCFLKSGLEMAQKLGLATRVLEFLVTLAEVDVCIENADAAEDKIRDIQIILGLEDKSPRHVSDEMDSENSSENTTVTKHSKRNLVVPALDKAASPCLSSPKDARRLPDFIKHSKLCMCYICSSATAQILCVKMTHIEALIGTMRFHAHDALNIYKNADKLAHHVSKSMKCNVRFWRLLHQYHDVVFAAVAIRISFADILSLYGKGGIALKKIDSAIALLDELRIPEVYLAAEAVEQKIAIMEIICDDETSKEEKSSHKVSSGEPWLCTPGKTDCGNPTFKTPANVPALKTANDSGTRKPLEVITPNVYTPNVYTPSPFLDVCAPRIIAFDTDEDEENSRRFFGACGSAKLPKKSERDYEAETETSTTRSTVRNLFETPVPKCRSKASKPSTKVKERTNVRVEHCGLVLPVRKSTRNSTRVKKI